MPSQDVLGHASGRDRPPVTQTALLLCAGFHIAVRGLRAGRTQQKDAEGMPAASINFRLQIRQSIPEFGRMHEIFFSFGLHGMISGLDTEAPRPHALDCVHVQCQYHVMAIAKAKSTR